MVSYKRLPKIWLQYLVSIILIWQINSYTICNVIIIIINGWATKYDVKMERKKNPA